MEEKMKGRLKIILTGLGIIIFAVIGLWEYMQMALYFDVPQVVVIMPVVGALAAVLLRKYSFVVPVCTIVISIVYQLTEQVGYQNAANGNNFDKIVINSKFNTILNNLPYIIIFMFIGIAGGFLVRVLINRNKSRVTGIICCVLGVVLTFGGGVLLFGNPLYPFVAKHAIVNFAEKYDSEEYGVSDVTVHYSMEDMEYQGRVEMNDGVIYVVYHERESGKVYE